MKLAIQTRGIKHALPYNAPKELERNSEKDDTTRRIQLLAWLEKNKIEVDSISQIAVKLQQELEAFQETAKRDFHIYHCKGVYGFLHTFNGYHSFRINITYYQEREIDISRPWYIKGEIIDGTYIESCANILVDDNNRIRMVNWYEMS